MGEWSKKIGEYGEDVVEKFLSTIGWIDPAKGIQINCLKKNNEHLNERGQAVHTHGIDFLYSYMSPLVDGQLNNVIISSKYKTEKYPNSPTKLFKWFMTDLINQMECFDLSFNKEEILSSFQFSSINDVGVLFWLNNQADSNDDLLSKIATARIEKINHGSIYIVDNKHAGFILAVLRYLKAKNEYRYNFYYPSTGRNINPLTRKDTGAIMPVEYLNSSIIPFKLVKTDNEKESYLMLASIDCFDKDTFMRLMGLAKDISTNLSGGIIIGFPDYNDLLHDTMVRQTKQGFNDSEFTKTVSVINFTDPLSVF